MLIKIGCQHGCDHHGVWVIEERRVIVHIRESNYKFEKSVSMSSLISTPFPPLLTNLMLFRKGSARHPFTEKSKSVRPWRVRVIIEKLPTSRLLLRQELETNCTIKRKRLARLAPGR